MPTIKETIKKDNHIAKTITMRPSEKAKNLANTYFLLVIGLVKNAKIDLESMSSLIKLAPTKMLKSIKAICEPAKEKFVAKRLSSE